MLELTLPSPVYRFRGAGGAERAELWVKDDGAVHPLYGGNKTRKLQAVLDDVAATSSRRILTFGAAGSHHVLATALFAGLARIPVHAILVREPHTEHVEEIFRAVVGQGISLAPAASATGAALAFARSYRRGDYLLGPGGAGLPATLAYAEAVRELERQVVSGELPEPAEIVVALGSGTTVAGLLAGLSATRLQSRVIAVDVTGSAWPRRIALRLASRAASALGLSSPRLGERLVIERGELGAGYGFPTNAGTDATRSARDAGLSLDPTYTAKAFAHALARVARPPAGSSGRVILYWHTLSSIPLEPLLSGAPSLASIEPRLRRLLEPLPR